MLDAEAAGAQGLCLLAPVGGLFVVDDMVCTELLQQVCLLGRRGGGDNACAGGFCELQGEDGDAACSLGEDRLAGLQGLEAVEGVPSGQGSAGEGAGFEEVEVGGHVDEALLIEGAILAEGTVDYTT